MSISRRETYILTIRARYDISGCTKQNKTQPSPLDVGLYECEYMGRIFSWIPPPPPNLFFFKVIRSLSKTLKKSSFGYKIDPVGVRVIMKIREKRRMTNKL